MQTSADHRSRRRHVSRMTGEKCETLSPSGMSKVRNRPESLVADCTSFWLVTDSARAFLRVSEPAEVYREKLLYIKLID